MSEEMKLINTQFKARYIAANQEQVGWVYWSIFGRIDKIEYDDGYIKDGQGLGLIDINSINPETVIVLGKHGFEVDLIFLNGKELKQPISTTLNEYDMTIDPSNDIHEDWKVEPKSKSYQEAVEAVKGLGKIFRKFKDEEAVFVDENKPYFSVSEDEEE